MNKKYELMQRKYPFTEYLYINVMPETSIKDANQQVSNELVKGFSEKFKNSVKYPLSKESLIEEREKDKSWIIDDKRSNQRYLIEKEEGLHTFNVVAKFVCSDCCNKIYDDNIKKCSYCTSGNLIAPQERFPEIDSSEIFPCPACKKTLSVDVIYQEENKCECGKRIEICNNCQGYGFVKSGIELSEIKQKLLNPHFFSKQILRARLIAGIPFVLLFLLIVLGFFTPLDEFHKVVEFIALCTIIPYVLWRFFKPKPTDRSLLKVNCMKCSSGERGCGVS